MRPVILLPLLLLLSLASPAIAQGIQVTPVSVELAPEQRVAVISVTNRGSQPTTFQVRPFLWSFDGTADQLTPTELLAVSPPLAEIQPGQTQTVRLLLRKTPTDREATFRILIDQLPPAATPGVIRIVLRLSIPVFAKPGASANPELAWQIRVDHGRAVLSVDNRGNRHSRITQAELVTDGVAASAPVASSPYVLPGAHREWPIATNVRFHPGATIRLRATSDLGPIEAVVPLVALP